MSSEYENFVSELLHLVEVNVLSNGDSEALVFYDYVGSSLVAEVNSFFWDITFYDEWESSKNGIKSLIPNERLRENFGAAFNDAVKKAFSETVDEVFHFYKIPQKLNQSFQVSSCHYSDSIEDSVQDKGLAAKLREKEVLESLLDVELGKVKAEKQDLLFLMSQTSIKKQEVDSLLKKEDELIIREEKTAAILDKVWTKFNRIQDPNTAGWQGDGITPTNNILP